MGHISGVYTADHGPLDQLGMLEEEVKTDISPQGQANQIHRLITK